MTRDNLPVLFSPAAAPSAGRAYRQHRRADHAVVHPRGAPASRSCRGTIILLVATERSTFVAGNPSVAQQPNKQSGRDRTFTPSRNRGKKTHRSGWLFRAEISAKSNC